MEAFVTAGAGFLLAVLWFDLMHDVLVRGQEPSGDLPDDALAAIATYYARVTTAARPATSGGQRVLPRLTGSTPAPPVR